MIAYIIIISLEQIEVIYNWSVLVFQTHELYVETPCTDYFQIGRIQLDRSQEVCEEKCIQASDCSFYFYSNEQVCVLYSKCESGDIYKAGKTYEIIRKPGKRVKSISLVINHKKYIVYAL